MKILNDTEFYFWKFSFVDCYGSPNNNMQVYVIFQSKPRVLRKFIRRPTAVLHFNQLIMNILVPNSRWRIASLVLCRLWGDGLENAFLSIFPFCYFCGQVLICVLPIRRLAIPFDED